MPKDYNIAPYYDDFDETKNFIRMLFNPGRAVQARELTQLQTILSSQGSKFANHFFKDGAKILGAKIELDRKIVGITINTISGGATNPSDFQGYYVKGKNLGDSSDTGAQAKVTLTNDATNQIFVAMRGGEFEVGDGIEVTDLDSNGDPAYTATITTVGTATAANLQDGIVYIEGAFVIVGEQKILVDPASDSGDWNIGFSVTEEEITSGTDNTLFDPAQGEYNFNAPGADRYKVSVALDKYAPGSEPIDGTFYTKMFVESGQIISEEAETAYSDILDLLAQRTYETNGDYTVDPFMSKVVDHDTDNTKFNIILDPGIAYVKGYRHETISETTLEIDKARDYLSNTESVWVDLSPYITIKREDMTHLPDVSKMGIMRFYATDATDSANWDNPTDNYIGTARVIGFTFTGTEYRLYLTDFESMQGDFASVKGVKSTVSSFIASTILEGADDFNPDRTILYSTTGNRVNAYRLAQSVLKSNDSSSFIHRIQKQTQATVAGATSTIGTLATEEIDLSQNPIIADADTGIVLVPNVDYTTSNSTTSDLIIDYLNGQANSVNVHYYVEVTGGARKSKIVQTYTETITADASGSVTLNFEDVISIASITQDPTGTPISLNVDNFTLDNGQRDFYYDKGVVTGSFTDTVDYEITYSYYVHGGSGNFFDIQSYLDSGIAQEDIPSYKSPTTSENMFLGDVIDFRRKLTDISSSGVPIPTPRTYMFCDYEYYLNRIDLLEIDKDGKFNVITGTSSLEPSAPEGNDNAMSLYVVSVPAYTYDVLDVYTGFIENKNYTMRDIGELEQRIGNLEYYSSLNLLEKDSNELDITDEFGNNKFKNGILVDNFIGGNVVDTEDPEYFCAFDPDAGHMRPVFDLNDVNLSRDESAGKHDALVDYGDGSFYDPVHHVRFHPHIATLHYTEVPWVQQGQASAYMNVNPYNVFAWDGDLTLTPDSDHWIDTQYVPDIVTNIDGLYDNLIQKAIDAYGTKWGSWKTNWTGRSVKTENIPGHGPRTATGWAKIDTSRLIRRDGVRGNTIRTTTTTSKQMRRGTRLVAVPNRIKKTTGERVIDVSVIPYMRSIPVQFEAKNLKPNTDLHCYFNDVLVDDHITAEAGFEPVDAATFSVRTDASGKCKGTYVIPNTDALRFRTGQRPFCLIDDTLVPTTSAEAEFIASGHLQKKQRSVLSISKPKLVTVGVTQQRTVSSTRSEFVGWYDPVAESFLVEQEGGLYITSIEVFFKTKDASLPVSIQVVTTDNGYPSQNQLPFSVVTLDPADVNVSDDSSVGTTFQFSDPVYLQNGTEYAFIVYSNSDAYNIWYGEIGAFDIEKQPDEERIVSQPYTGVFFKSQNGSTWTADQTKDLKFNINRAKFLTKTGDLKTGDLWLIDDLDLLDGDLNDQQVDLFATDCQFEIDNIIFDLTELKFAYKFYGQSLFTESINGDDVPLETQIHITNDIDNAGALPKHCEVNVYMSTENDYVSPMVSVQRSHVILINNTLFGWNQQPYENIYKVPLTDPTVDVSGFYDAGAYVSRPTTLINPSDDIKVIMDVWKQGNSDVDVYFSTGKFSPKYVEIFDTTVTEARSEMKGEKLHLFNQASADDTVTKQTELSCTGIDQDNTPNRIYITGVGDPSTFLYNTDWTAAVKRQFLTTEEIPDATVVADWATGTDYGPTSGNLYVFYQNYIWKALEDSGNTYGGPVEPTEYGTAWQQIPFNEVCEDGVAGEEIKTDTERTWRPMVIESQDQDEGKATSDFVEYTWVPKDTVEEEFSIFSIKIQLKSKDPTLVPLCSGLRAIATY